jgi:hypothetical protein
MGAFSLLDQALGAAIRILALQSAFSQPKSHFA